MAMVLKQQFDLLALKVSLRLESGRQKVDFALEYYGSGEEPRIDGWTADASSLLPASSDSRSSQLIGVGRRVAKALDPSLVPADVPLWLHLAKPYGWLATLPWEQAIEERANRPVLRLPDFLERPRENMATLDVVICSDLAEIPATVEQLDRVITAALAGSPRAQTSVLVFALAENGRALRRKFGIDSRVWIAPTPSPSSNADSSPWLSAIAQALRESSADVVHFICRASAVGGQPVLRLTDPSRVGSSAATARFISIGETASLLTRIGAWAAVCTLPHGEPESDLRWFADALAQARPGAVLFDVGADLVPFYRFLFAEQPSAPPRVGSNFMYCQPRLAMGDPALAQITALAQNASLFLNTAAQVTGHPSLKTAARVAGKVVSFIPTVAEAVGLRAPTAPSRPNATPTWVAAAQRFVEATSLELVRRRSNDPLLANHLQTLAGTPSDSSIQNAEQIKESDIVDRTLSELQTIIAQHAPKAG